MTEKNEDRKEGEHRRQTPPPLQASIPSATNLVVEPSLLLLKKAPVLHQEYYLHTT